MTYLAGILKSECVTLEYPEALYAKSQAAACLMKQAVPQYDSYVKRINDIESHEAVKRQEAAIAIAETEADAMLENAQVQGRAEGFDEGARLGMEECEKLTGEQLALIDTQLRKNLNKITAESRKNCESLRNGQIESSLKLASEILYYELAQNESAFLKLFANAASHIAETENAVLKVGPRGYEIAVKHIGELEKSIEGLKKLEIRLTGDDDGLCVIETPYRSIDASIDTQLRKAARTLGVTE